MENKTVGNRFALLVLFSAEKFSARQLAADLGKDWGIAVPREDVGEENLSLVSMVDGMPAAVFLTPGKVPSGAAERDARTNYLWEKAGDVARAHKAYVTVAVQQGSRTPINAACLAVKIAASILTQKKSSGVLAAGTLMSPDFYRKSAFEGCAGGRIPVMNLVYIGLYTLEGKTMNGYTNGLAALGSREAEILDSTREPEEIFNLLATVATLELERPGLLKDGDTLGAPGGGSCGVRFDKGRAVPGQSLKIAF